MGTTTEGVIDELDMGLKVTRNARFLKELGDKIRRGNLAAVLLGGIPGAAVYGYDMVRRFDEGGEPIRGVRAVNEGEAAVVREMFKRCAAGESSQAICGRINARGVPAPKGGRWVPPTLTGQAAARTGILRRTLYKGVVTYYRRQFRTHPETGRRVAVLRKLEEWIAVPAPELAIVEEDLFEAAQQQLAARAWLPTSASARRASERRWAGGRPLVSQKLFCAAHDEPMRTIRSRLYNCPARNCPNHNLQLDRDDRPDPRLEHLVGLRPSRRFSVVPRVVPAGALRRFASHPPRGRAARSL